jgi:hydroxymethylglutaryl-CoA synthase
MAVVAPDEDPVVLAAGAAETLFERYDVDPASIGMVIVGTESGVDAAKPIAAYVHRLAGLSRDCRVFDVQHACYGGTAALRMALAWLRAGFAARPRALVIATDIARYDVGSPGEPTQGAAAVAMLLGPDPRVFAFDDHREAVHTREVMDFWRPAYRATALADGHYSIRCYLEALEHCHRVYAAETGRTFRAFDHLLYHVPFPKMALKAHHHLDALFPEGREDREGGVHEDFGRRVMPGLWANLEVGNCYSASLYLSLAGLLEHAERDVSGARVGLFSYGSGSCAEFLSGRAGGDPAAWRGRTGLRDGLASRTEIGHDTYVRFRRAAESLARNGGFRVLTGTPGFGFCGTVNDQRVYRDRRGILSIPEAAARREDRAEAGRAG